jgi:hypothetical protein
LEIVGPFSPVPPGLVSFCLLNPQLKLRLFSFVASRLASRARHNFDQEETTLAASRLPANFFCPSR